ncbi:heterokaryon incompatibility protein-domain-containing protein [Podospora didyma]|uniref:Heterokaryon incompatibility protein-domain-containing protein n=1 Tax=Podospora didyma TaxID=330526 RepID=A0AAE0N3H2_9PEZI|nr:heterokaryon incompatibility protein-domain-containing protein [Podospora didyma]
MPRVEWMRHVRKAGGHYRALSYAWGDPDITAPITVNDCLHHVTLNLQSALRHLRHDSVSVVLWVDAVCINQSHSGEKGIQVRQMGRIYRDARDVVVWLGEEADDSNLLLERIAESVEVDDPDSLPPFKGDDEDEPVRLARAFLAFSRRAWWTRLWVIQELILAKEVSFHCGHRAVSETKLRVNNLTQSTFSHLANQGIGSAPELVDASLMKSLGDMFRLVALRGQAMGAPAKDTAKSTLDQLVVKFSESHVSRPEDKIYALFGLATDADAYGVPDYSKDAATVYVDFARTIITGSGGLRLLLVAGLGSNALAIPSWVPDWTSRRYHSWVCCALLNLQATAGLGLKADFAISPDSRTLRIRGVICDTVCTIAPAPVAGQGSWLHPDAYFSAAGHPLLYSTDTNRPVTRLEALFRTILNDQSLDREPLDKEPKALHRAGATFLYGLGDGIIDEETPEHTPATEPAKAAGEQQCPDYISRFLRWTRQARNGRSNKQILELFLGELDSQSDLHKPWLESENDIGGSNYLEYQGGRSLVNNDSGGHLLETGGGLFGMASDLVQKGDVICVLFGCEMPFVMRRSGSKWTMVQSCFVFDLMRGEANDMIRKGKYQEQEFRVI